VKEAYLEEREQREFQRLKIPYGWVYPYVALITERAVWEYDSINAILKIAFLKIVYFFLK
jgi:hypothetical protein